MCLSVNFLNILKGAPFFFHLASSWWFEFNFTMYTCVAGACDTIRSRERIYIIGISVRDRKHITLVDCLQCGNLYTLSSKNWYYIFCVCFNFNCKDKIFIKLYGVVCIFFFFFRFWCRTICSRTIWSCSLTIDNLKEYSMLQDHMVLGHW